MNKGTNLTGGDTAWQDWSGSTPVSGTHYLFVTSQDVDYLLKKGCNSFRLLFGWEAMQPIPLGTVPSTATAHAVYFNKFKALVDYITSKGAQVIIDIHDGNDADFAAYYGKKVGDTYAGYSVSALLIDLWVKLAKIFKSNPLVAFGITNEPHDIAASDWYNCAQLIVNGIRATGAANLIVMPGIDWTAAGTWTSGSNGSSWTITDSLKNTAVQVHLYADANSGGWDTSIVSATILADRMKQVTSWARTHGLKVMVGEVGLSASNSLAASCWANFVDFCNSNSDVVLGYHFWAYGPPAWWGGYQFTLCPTSNYTTDSPQMRLIAPSLAAVPDLQAQVNDLTAKLAASQTALSAANITLTKIKALLP